MGSQNPTEEKNKSPVGEEGGKRTGEGAEGRRGGGQGDGEEDGKKRGILEKETKQQSILGTCRARQVDTETKWSLFVPDLV